MTIIRDEFLPASIGIMKIQPDRSDNLSITAYGDSWIAVNGKQYPHSLFISFEGLIHQWEISSLEGMEPKHANLIFDSDCEILIWGSGRTQKMLSPQVLIGFFNKGIGVESMDTAAACRTFNILRNEGRKVSAIFLLDENL